MSTLFRLLSLLLCFELIVAPFAPNISLMGQNAFADEGTCSSGFQWDSTLNRCLTSTETANVMNATSSCGAGDVECYKSNAESALNTAQSNGQVSKEVANMGTGATAMNAAAVAVPLGLAAYMLWGAKKDGVKCKSYSLYAMVAAGAALFAGDLIANMQHKKRLADIKKDWDKIINEGAVDETNADTKKSNATEAQSQAFEMLARSEDSMAAAAKMKSIFNATAMAAFAAVAAWSTYETIDLYQARAKMMAAASATPFSAAEEATATKTYNEKYAKYTCTKEKLTYKPHTDKSLYVVSQNNLLNATDLASFHILLNEQESLSSSYSSPSIDEFNEISTYWADLIINKDTQLLKRLKEATITVASNINPFQQAIAQEEATEANGFGSLLKNKMTAFTGKAKDVIEGIDKQLKTPVTRAVISGIFAGWSGIMYAHAKKQASASKERAKYLRKMKEDFNVASGAINMCTAEDRTNSSKPECYCYTSEGQRNSNRTNSAICTKLFTGIDTTEGNYYGSTASSTNGCIASSGTFDSTCSCKATNSCLKASAVSGITGLSTGTFSMLSKPLSTIDGISNGSIDTASVNGDAAVSNAMRILDATKKLDNTKGLESVKAAKSAASNGLENSLISGASGISPNLGSSDSGAGFGNMTPSQAAAMLQKEIDSSTNTIGSVGAGNGSFTPVSGGGLSDTPQLDFGLSGTGPVSQKDQVAEVMKQDFDYGANDINEGSKTNIFEVLSNRYQRSGMRRLFDEKGTTKGEVPAKTDISK